MLQLKIGIVEDEALVAETIRQLLLNLNYEVLEPASNYGEAVWMLERGKPDLVILDIRLGDKKNNGIKLAEFINKNYAIPFIFLTANADKATVSLAKATKPSAFLVKPFNKNDLFTSIEVAFANHVPTVGYANVPFLFLKTGEKYIKVSEMEIMYIESNHIYLDIHTTTKKFVIRSTVDDFLNKLSKERFFKIGRSFIINIYFVTSFDQESVEINGTQLPISKTYRRLFMDKMTEKKYP